MADASDYVRKAMLYGTDFDRAWKIYQEVQKTGDQQQKLLEAFNLLAGQVVQLTEEVRQLREELAPQTLDKQGSRTPLEKPKQN